MAENSLGKSTVYPDKYQPELLVGIPRQDNRRILGISDDELPFTGADIWNAYEISCLDVLGRPRNFIGRFIFPVQSECLIESKSLKLYLNSLNQDCFESAQALSETICNDLSDIVQCSVEVGLELPGDVSLPELPAGTCLDDLQLEIQDYQVSAELLKSSNELLYEEIVEEVLYTNLFRSNCPITNQPDWATVTICYHGKRIPRENLLKYLVSYRQHNDYHENCVERIFCDLKGTYMPQSLTVEANFLRRGGLDINPVRTTESALNYQAFPRYIRQ